MRDWLPLGLVGLLALLAQPTLWVCLTLLAVASIIGRAIERAARSVALARLVLEKHPKPRQALEESGAFGDAPTWENIIRLEAAKQQLDKP